MKTFSAALFTFLLASGAFAAEPVTGVWKTIDDETGEAKSLVRIYEFEGKVYGRVIKVFKEPEKKAVGIKGSPKIEGLDIIWDMKDTGEKFTGGRILDPKKGKIYRCEIWKEKDGTLTVRGKIGPFGRSQKWLWEKEADPKTKLTPSIPEEE